MNASEIKELVDEVLNFLTPNDIEDMFIGFSKPLGLDGFKLFIRKKIVNQASLNFLNKLIIDCKLEMVDNLKEGYWTIKTVTRKA